MKPGGETERKHSAMKKEDPKKQRDSKGRFVKGNKYTFPKGKSGNPSGGHWKAEDSIGFQYKKLVKMTADEFESWLENNPEKERTVAQELAYQAIVEAKEDLSYLKEVTDRTEGRASQSVDVTSGGEPIPLLDYTKEKKE